MSRRAEYTVQEPDGRTAIYTVDEPDENPISLMAREGGKSAIRSMLPGGEFTADALGIPSAPIETANKEADQAGKWVSRGLPTSPSLKTPFGTANPRNVTGALVGGALRPTSIVGAVAAPGLAAEEGLGSAASDVFNAMKGDFKNAVMSPIRTASKVPDFLKYQTFDLSPQNLTNKAEKLTTEILQPSKGELSNAISRNRQLPAVEKSAPVIKPSKNYTQLRQALENHISETMNERNGLLKQMDTVEGNKPIGDYTSKLENYIKEEISKGQSTPQEIKQMQDVLKRERDYLSKNPLDRVKAQSRKEELQDLTDTLLQKTEHGDVIDTQPARNRALDQIRRGLKEKIETGLSGKPNTKIIEANSKYGGLKRAKELIAGQEALSKKAIPANPIQKLGRFIFNPKDIPGAIASEALNREGSLSNQTKKIYELMKKAKSQ